jgi:hypothetical protein
MSPLGLFSRDGEPGESRPANCFNMITVVTSAHTRGLFGDTGISDALIFASTGVVVDLRD